MAPQARGGPPVNYIDATDDDMAGAIAPKLRYSVEGNAVTVRIRLVADKKEVVTPETVSYAKTDPELAKKLAEKIVAMATGK